MSVLWQIDAKGRVLLRGRDKDDCAEGGTIDWPAERLAVGRDGRGPATIAIGASVPGPLAGTSATGHVGVQIRRPARVQRRLWVHDREDCVATKIGRTDQSGDLRLQPGRCVRPPTQEEAYWSANGHSTPEEKNILRKMIAKASRRPERRKPNDQQRVQPSAWLPVYPHPATYDQKSKPPVGSSVLLTPNCPVFRVTF